MDHDEYVEDDLGSSVSSYTDDANSKELGRFMLRTGGKTIAAGMVADT